MLAGGQIAGVSGLLPHCIWLKHSHESWGAPQYHQPLLKDHCLSLFYEKGYCLLCLPACLFMLAFRKLCPDIRGGMCWDISLMQITHMVRTLHILRLFSLFEPIMLLRRPEGMLLYYAGVNLHCVSGLELGHDIDMIIFTCAWLHESFFSHHL